MYSRIDIGHIDLSFIDRHKTDTIWDALMGLRAQYREKDSWPGTVRDAYETLEVAFARINVLGDGLNRPVTSQLNESVWRHAVLVAQDYLLQTESHETEWASRLDD